MISIEQASIGALDDGSQAICITFAVSPSERCVVYGLLLPDNDTVECSFGPICPTVADEAKRLVRRWADGSLTVPYYTAAERDDCV